MKNAALILNAVLLVAVAVLFYLHFSSTKPAKKEATVAGAKVEAASNDNFRVGYFEWDSVENNIGLFKQIQEELKQKDESFANAKMRMRQEYQNKINSYSQKQLSQTESEAATQEIKNLEKRISNDMQRMDQEMQELQMRKTNEVRLKIEEFLKEYNKDKGFSYILAYEPNIIFYKDTNYNITADLIRGLNEKFPAKK